MCPCQIVADRRWCSRKFGLCSQDQLHDKSKVKWTHPPPPPVPPFRSHRMYLTSILLEVAWQAETADSLKSLVITPVRNHNAKRESVKESTGLISDQHVLMNNTIAEQNMYRINKYPYKHDRSILKTPKYFSVAYRTNIGRPGKTHHVQRHAWTLGGHVKE